MFDKELFEKDPRGYALELWESGWVDSEAMITILLKYMSHDDVRGALDVNELSPRFDGEE